VDVQPAPEAKRPRSGRVWVIAAAVVAALTLVAALLVVARNLRKLRPEPLPPALATVPPDTNFVIFRAGIRRKTGTLAVRCRTKRRQLGEKMTPEQDSMSRECDSAIARVRVRISAMDTGARENRKAAADSVKAEYERAKLAVRIFTRSGLGGSELSDDSLDEELKKLISE
jgi:hypothetical protein